MVALSIALAVILPGGGASWPTSVATVKQEIEVACQNPDIPSDPAQVNFACATDTDQILWVFALLTSDDNPDFTDPATSRTGLEPITPAQGGEVAWSLNLHHPYNPLNPIDSLAVAARAINNIIGGATITSQAGAQVVQPGLESSPANCLRYTGSTAVVVRQGFPRRCAPVRWPARPGRRPSWPMSTSSGWSARRHRTPPTPRCSSPTRTTPGTLGSRRSCTAWLPASNYT